MVERFSYIVEEYFMKKGTTPVIFSYRPYNCPDLDDLQDHVFHHFQSMEDIEVEITRKLDDEYWPGVLVELSTDVSDFNLETIRLYNEIVPDERSITGLSIGRDAYCSANLESLGKEYFRQF